MPLSFADAPGNIFNRLGKLGAMIVNVRNYQSTQQSSMIGTTGVTSTLTTEPDIQAIMGSQYINILNAAGATTVGSFCQQLAQAVVNRQVYRSQAQFNQTLTSVDVTSSLLYLIQQMISQGASVLAQTITATPVPAGAPNGPHFIGAGTGILNASVIRPSDGRVCENSYGETLTFTCTSDSYLNNTPVGNEGFVITGQGADGSIFDFDWPLGSNCSIQLNAIDGNADNTNGNILTNSGFEAWTGDVPDNWEVVSGGSLISKQGTIIYDGSYSLQIAGDGSTDIQIRQLFDNTTGTSGNLLPLNTYSFCVFMRRGGTTPNTGTVIWDLTDANGTVIQDAAGNNVTFSTNLSALTTSFAQYTAAFRTPHVMPSSLYLRMRTTPESGVFVYIDKASLGDFNRLYAFGPFVAVHAGSIPFQSGDYAYMTIANSRGLAGTLTTFQTLFFQLFNDLVTQNDLLLPSSSSPTISDGLIA